MPCSLGGKMCLWHHWHALAVWWRHLAFCFDYTGELGSILPLFHNPVWQELLVAQVNTCRKVSLGYSPIKHTQSCRSKIGRVSFECENKNHKRHNPIGIWAWEDPLYQSVHPRTVTWIGSSSLESQDKSFTLRIKSFTLRIFGGYLCSFHCTWRRKPPFSVDCTQHSLKTISLQPMRTHCCSS